MQITGNLYSYGYNLNNAYKHGIRLNTLQRDTVSFGKGKDINKEVKEIPEASFPSPEFREFVLANIDGSDILTLHKEYYAGLLDCKSLDEAKRLFPEFQGVVDMNDIDLSEVNRQSLLHKIARGEIPGLNKDNASLELLKKYCGELLPLKEHRSEYFGLNNTSINKLLRIFNIKMDAEYERVIKNQRHSNSAVTLWQNNEFRTRTSSSIKKAANTAEHKELISRITSARWQDDDYKKKMSDKLSERWQDEDFRQRTIESLRRAGGTEEFRKKMADITTRLWQDESFRQKAVEGIRRVANTEEFKQKISETSSQRWQDESFREKSLIAIKNATTTDEFRQKMADIAIQQWQDEEYREKTLHGIRKATSSDEYRQKMAETTRLLWQDEEYVKLHKVRAAAHKLAFRLHPYAQEAYHEVSKDFPRLGAILSKPADSLLESEIIYRKAYFKACSDRYPDLKKEVGEIQKQILASWGFYDKDRDVDKMLEIVKSLNLRDDDTETE